MPSGRSNCVPPGMLFGCRIAQVSGFAECGEATLGAKTRTVGKWGMKWRLMAGGQQKLTAALGQAPESGGCVAGLDPGSARQLTISRAIDPAESQLTLWPGP